MLFNLAQLLFLGGWKPMGDGRWSLAGGGLILSLREQQGNLKQKAEVTFPCRHQLVSWQIKLLLFFLIRKWSKMPNLNLFPHMGRESLTPPACPHGATNPMIVSLFRGGQGHLCVTHPRTHNPPQSNRFVFFFNIFNLADGTSTRCPAPQHPQLHCWGRKR